MKWNERRLAFDSWPTGVCSARSPKLRFSKLVFSSFVVRAHWLPTRLIVWLGCILSNVLAENRLIWITIGQWAVRGKCGRSILIELDRAFRNILLDELCTLKYAKTRAEREREKGCCGMIWGWRWLIQFFIIILIMTPSMASFHKYHKPKPLSLRPT